MCYNSLGMAKCRVIGASTLTLVSAVLALGLAFSSLLSPIMKYSQINISFFVALLVDFIVLVVAGSLGFVGLKKRRPCAVQAMFIMDLLVAFMIIGESMQINYLYYNYQPIRGPSLTCAQRYEEVTDLINAGSSTVTNQLCSSTCPCDFTRDTTTVTFVNSLSSGGPTKIQQCTSLWRSQFDAAADVLAEMEVRYGCTGFCETPSQNRFTFSDVNEQTIYAPCGPKFGIYVGQAFRPVYQPMIFTSILVMIALILLLINFCAKFKEGKLKTQTVVVPVNETEQELRPY